MEPFFMGWHFYGMASFSKDAIPHSINVKKFSTIACCGIDCGLCPQFHSNAKSACPGCGGEDFKLKHPSCGIHTCCVTKRGLETCADCTDFPCPRFDNDSGQYDSFVTHRRVYPNLNSIRSNGYEPFLDQQRLRIDILKDFLLLANAGRSKNFYCLACALLPLENLTEGHSQLLKMGELLDVKQRCYLLRLYLQSVADSLSIELKLIRP
jgi:hypothetical protein